jgi:putative membrane protein
MRAMMYWDGAMGAWGYILPALSYILFWAAVITAIILFARHVAAGRRHEGEGPTYGVAEHLLAERFARGEIDESEYLARLAVLRRGRTG